LIISLIAVVYCYLDGHKVEVINGVGEEDVDYNEKSQYFDRPNVTIYQGDSIMWQWDATHNVVQVYSDRHNVSISESHEIDGFGCQPVPQGNYFWTFNQLGDFYYICEPHIECCNMRGVIHVVPRPQPLNDQLGGSGVGGVSSQSTPQSTATMPTTKQPETAVGVLTTITRTLIASITPVYRVTTASLPGFLNMLAFNGASMPATDLLLSTDSDGRASSAPSGAVSVESKVHVSDANKHHGVVDGDADVVVDTPNGVTNHSTSSSLWARLYGYIKAYPLLGVLLFFVLVLLALPVLFVLDKLRRRWRGASKRKSHVILHANTARHERYQ